MRLTFETILPYLFVTHAALSPHVQSKKDH